MVRVGIFNQSGQPREEDLRPKGKGSPGTAVSLVLSVIGFLIQLGALNKRIFHPWASLPLISDSTFPALG